jgi:hypothetical protein
MVTPRSRLRRTLAAAGGIAIAVLTLHSVFSVTFARARPLARQPEVDCAARYAARYARARPLLPAHGVLGWFGPDDVEGECNAKQVAQHALAPILLVDVGDEWAIERVRRLDLVAPSRPPLAIVDLAYPRARSWMQSQHDYRVVAEVGDDVVVVALGP